MTAPRLPQAINLDDPAFRDALAEALRLADIQVNPELMLMVSIYGDHGRDLYRDRADKVLRILRDQLGCEPA
jgi:hypothetical protein